MNAETIFSVANTLVLPGWLALIVVPRVRWIPELVCAVVIPGLLGIAYVAVFWSAFVSAEGGFGSLPEVMMLFENPWVALAGWIHYLAFDLFVGAWEVRTAQRDGIHHLVVIPCLLLTFMAGPTGWLLFLVVRGAWRRKLSVVEAMA